MRLQGTNDIRRGRLEIYRLGFSWTRSNWTYTVCDRAWHLNDARVACREIGFSGASAVRYGAYYGKGSTGKYVLDIGPRCSGTEASLRDCERSSSYFRSRGCWSHDRDVGIDCY